MKTILIRDSVFETNSSSAHSLSINKGNKILNVFDTLKPNENGIVNINCGGYNFNRQKPRRTNNTIEKIAFFVTLFDYWETTYGENRIQEIIKLIEQNSLCEGVVLEGIGDSSIEFCRDFEVPEGLQLYRAIFDKNSWLFIMGDEYEIEGDEQEFYNPPEII